VVSCLFLLFHPAPDFSGNRLQNLLEKVSCFFFFFFCFLRAYFFSFPTQRLASTVEYLLSSFFPPPFFALSRPRYLSVFPSLPFFPLWCLYLIFSSPFLFFFFFFLSFLSYSSLPAQDGGAIGPNRLSFFSLSSFLEKVEDPSLLLFPPLILSFLQPFPFSRWAVERMKALFFSLSFLFPFFRSFSSDPFLLSLFRLHFIGSKAAIPLFFSRVQDVGCNGRLSACVLPFFLFSFIKALFLSFAGSVLSIKSFPLSLFFFDALMPKTHIGAATFPDLFLPPLGVYFYFLP